ncbi:PREDICTED: ecto-ADP-ribosyltransferase 4 [Chrysochloris asiatica]|uniref:NAD(P)(+)--arginine ADP-ribosyltransferase n=1 Tax=Chrysochloris asiatica TaxID=185453 RepID=A0A9B0WSB5_CHRAS|nr:PREDICTED: ecto-ADP-ribosyltransferase 4 [Chrysochloris asiatica]
MRLQGPRRSTFNASKYSSLTSICKRSLLFTTAAPARKICLLLLLSNLQKPTWSSQVETKIDFDLAPDSFDDQYQGCSQQVIEALKQGNYFTKELEDHRNYSSAWQKAYLTWLNQHKALPSNMTTAHAVAILVYTLNKNVRSDFTKAMASAGKSPRQYHHSFHFKYLHYYLTSAIQLLRKEIVLKNANLCYEVYHRSTDISFKPHPGAIIRFGQFLSTSLLREEAQTFGDHTVFNISTCLGASVENFSLKKEILIPPYELFEVVNVSHGRGNWLQLQSAGNLSTYNCQLLKASSNKCVPAPLATASLLLLTSVIITS